MLNNIFVVEYINSGNTYFLPPVSSEVDTLARWEIFL